MKTYNKDEIKKIIRDALQILTMGMPETEIEELLFDNTVCIENRINNWFKKLEEEEQDEDVE